MNINNNINLSSYYKMAQISQSLNRFIRQAMVTKAQISTSMNNAIPSIPGIGNNIDTYAWLNVNLQISV